MNQSRIALPTAVLVVALAAGCGSDGYAELGLVPVTGAVTLNGQPLAGAKVVFEGEDKRAALGTTDAAGKYVLMYDSQTPGATPGRKIVRITLADGQVEGGGAAEGAAPAKESIPARYNKQSELSADVAAGNKSFDFALQSSP